jgi:transposase-like protein
MEEALRGWRSRSGGSRAQPAEPRAGDASPVALADEVVRLRAELQAVSRQRDILKKALSIVGQDSLRASS